MRRFNGWEPEQVHVHEYDGSGRLVRTVVTTEPEWDDEQRALVQDLIDYKRNLCRKCHGHRSKTHDKNLQRDYQDVQDKCWDCDIIEAQYALRHAKHGKNDCDCADRAIWITGYRPLPPSRGTGLRSS